MLSRLCLFLCCFLCLSSVDAALPRANLALLKTQLKQAKQRLRPLLRDIARERKAIIEEWIRLSQIPAPSGQEQKRGAAVAAQFRAAGLKVRIDSVGNVIGLLKGTNPRLKKKVVLCAHMDTVFSKSTNIKVRRKGHLLFGPGVQDDTSGVISLVVLARLFRRHNIRLERDVWFVGTVQEEVGLKGAKVFFTKHRAQVDSVISIDGGYGGVSYGAVGIHWYKATFSGQSRHTLSSYRKPSTTHALGKAIARIYKLRVPQKPYLRKTWYNIGRIGGGTVTNAQASKAWLTLDLRSMSPVELAKMEKKVFAILRQSAAEVGVKVQLKALQKLPAMQLAGMREHRLVQAAKLVLQSQGVKNPGLKPFGANDHCIALKLGIPGINIGTTQGGKIHSLKEYADTRKLVLGLQQGALLLAMMARLSQSRKKAAPTTRPSR
jgi:acetylornithine deacetylase/succinyl-diaminopimelate desuccinylase-like protein